MSKPVLSFLAVCGFFLICGAWVHGQPPKDLKRNDVFGPDKLWTIHLKIGAKEYPAMTPKGGMNFGFPPKKGEPPPKKEEKKPDADPNADVHKSKGFGMEFPWVKGDLEFNEKVVKDVGIRYTGNSTYQMSAQGIKRPFKIDVNHFIEEQKVFGMNGLTLRNGVADSTRLREALGYSIFRAARVPAPRTAFVKLYLSVPEKHDNTYVGLYTLVENVDKPFLKAHFGNDKGMLLKPEKVQGLPYMGEKWEPYKDKFNPKREPTDAQKRRLIEFTKLVNQADDATFNSKIGGFLDVDEFLRFAAANSLIGNLDSFFGLGHNYYMYLNPKDNKFSFIPWDLDLSFGGMGFGAGPNDQVEWAIAQPYMGKNRLAERILAIKEHNEAYRGHLKTLAEGAYSAREVGMALATMEKTIKDALAKEPAQKGFGFPGGKKQDLREFATKRTESVIAQLEGKSQGKQIAGMGFGGPGGKGAFGPGNRLVKPVFEVADADKNGKLSLDEFTAAAAKLFKEAGGNDKTPASEESLIETINRLLPPPKGFGGFKPPPPPKGFGPGKGMTAAILKFTGAADKKVSREQFMSGAEKLFKQWDKNKSDSLDDKEFVDGVNAFVPPPEFLAPPAFGPGPADPKKIAPGTEAPKEKSR
jgi:spore coat protein H